MLAQQASGYDVGGHNFHIQEQPMHKIFNFFRAGADQSAKPTHLVGSADFPSAEAKLAQPAATVGQADSSKSAKLTAIVSSTDSPVISPINSSEKLPNRSNETSSGGADLDDWRIPVLRYSHGPNTKVDKCSTECRVCFAP
jgi:hypothetical protein